MLVHASVDRLEGDLAVELAKAATCCFSLVPTDVCFRVEDLTVEVAQLNTVEIDDGQVSDPGGSEVVEHWGFDSSRADADDSGLGETLLGLVAELRHEFLSVVSGVGEVRHALVPGEGCGAAYRPRHGGGWCLGPVSRRRAVLPGRSRLPRAGLGC